MEPVTIGLLAMGAGTALNMAGTAKRDKAQKRAMKDYQRASGAKASADQEAMRQHSGVLSGLANERQRGIGNYISELTAAGQGYGGEEFSAGQKGILSDISKQTGGNDSAYAYQGAPRTESERTQGGITESGNKRMAEAMLADHLLRQRTERETSAAHRTAFADLLRQGRGKTAQERYQLAQALRDLDFQKQTGQLQGQLDAAGRVGQTQNMLGGLMTQAGSMYAMYGLSNPGTVAGAAPVAGQASGAAAASTYGEAADPSWGTSSPEYLNR